jgi:hypothetical protein
MEKRAIELLASILGKSKECPPLENDMVTRQLAELPSSIKITRRVIIIH